MESSDDEFVWADTSKDDSDSEIAMPDDGESEDKSYKKKLQNELFQNGGLDSSAEAEEPRKRKKKHKRERASRSPPPASPPASPPPAPRVKRERGGARDDDAAAEHIFNMKVKEERVSFVAPRESPRKRRASSVETEHEPKKKKKKRDKRERHESSATEARDGPESPRKKRKRKRDSEGSSVSDRGLIIDKFEAEETVVEQRSKVNGQDEPDHRARGYPSKEFVEDDDSSDEERLTSGLEKPEASKSAASPVRPRASDAKTESPRKVRLSERITFESQSESEIEAAPETPGKSRKSRHVSPERDRKISERSSERISPERRLDRESPERVPKSSGRPSESERAQKTSRRISFERRLGRESSERGPQTSERRADGKRTQSISERITFEESQSEAEPPECAPRTSERITFEESQSDAEPGAGRARGGARLARFRRAHAHLQPAAGASPAAAALSPADDVWLLRCPRDLPAAALTGATLALDARSKLKAGGRALEAAPAPAAGRVALLLPGAGAGGGPLVRALRLRGALRLRARLPRPRAPPAAAAASPERVPPPAARARHPLLGADHERAGDLPPAVRRRLAAARRPPDAAADADASPDATDATDAVDVTDAPVPKKQKKKKRPRERQEPEPEVKMEEPKKRKRKHSPRPEPEPRESESSPKKKKVKKEKREKKRRDDAAVWDSERAIEESLFDF